MVKPKMPQDYITLQTPKDLADARRQLHLAIVFLCGRTYLASGTMLITTPGLQEESPSLDLEDSTFAGVGFMQKIPVGKVTGMYCASCQGELRQNGSCMICVNCGTTTGCS